MHSNIALKTIVDDFLELADDSCVAILPHLLRVTVELRIPDALSSGPMSLDELACHVACDPTALWRLLRALQSIEIVRSQSPDSIHLTDAGRRLLPNHSQSVRASLRNAESAWAWLSASETVRTGRPAFDDVNKARFFGHKDDDDTANRAFLQRMRERAARMYHALDSTIDWTQTRTVMDVGGGDGFLLTRILEQEKHLEGMLFDRPAATALVESRRPGFAADISKRLSTHSGDFFQEIPAGADTHVMCSVLHDWADGDVTAILANSRRALTPGGRLLIVEMLLPEDESNHSSIWSDLGMMVLTGGQERTLPEFESLLGTAGFALEMVSLLPNSPFSVMVARPVPVSVAGRSVDEVAPSSAMNPDETEIRDSAAVTRR